MRRLVCSSALTFVASCRYVSHKPSTATGTVATPGSHRSPITALLWEQREIEAKNAAAALTDPSTTATSAPPSPIAIPPSASIVEVHYTFQTNPQMKDKYRNYWGSIDKGMMLEDMDALAGSVAFRHIAAVGGGHAMPLIVTAKVDEIVARGKINTDVDLKMVGRVVFVGGTSMHVRCEVFREGVDAAEEPVVFADFVFASRDKSTNKPKAIPPLDLGEANNAAKILFEQKAAAVKKEKKARAERHSQLVSSTAAHVLQEDVAKLLSNSQATIRMPCLPASVVAQRHAADLAEAVPQSQPLTGEGVTIPQTALQNTFICRPQQRNTAGRIFGGFLMRRAYELALSTAFCFAGSTPRFLWVDEVAFRAPVSVGNVLRLESHVLLSEPQRIPHQRVHCEVTAFVLRPESAKTVLSNKFTFSFSLDEGAPTVVSVHPTNTGEAVKQLQLAERATQIQDWSK